MANKIVNRVKMTVTGTPGTGTITLGSAVSGFQSMAGAGVVDTDTVPYVIEDGSAWELGVGTITVSGSTYTMSRSVTASSNSGSPISASSSALVFITPLAADLQSGTSANNLVRLDGSAKLPTVDGSALTNLNASNIASGTVPASLLPNPTSTTLGGVKSKASISNYFLTQIGTDGSVSSAQPAFTDISGTLSVAKGGTGLTSLGTGVTTALGNAVNGASGICVQDASGRLYVGYSSATARLNLTNGVAGTAGQSNQIVLYDGTPGDPSATFGFGIVSGQLTYNCGGGAHVFYTGGNASPSERMRLDAAGNLGLGVTPSASWQNTRRVLQVGGSGAVWAQTSGAGTLFLSNNTFFDGSNFRYINTSGASYTTQQTDGSFTWLQAASGTAGQTISFTQAMTLTSGGRLGIGQTSPDTLLHINTVSAAYALTIEASSVTSRKYQLGMDSSGGLSFYDTAAASVRMVLDSSGRLLVGTTSTLGFSEKLGVAGGIATTGAQFNMQPGQDYEFVQRSAYKMNFYVNTASVMATLSITGVWTNASDARIKSNIHDIEYGLDAVMASKPRSFFKNGSDKPQVGFTAQELQKVIPDVVYGSDDEQYTVDYGSLTAVAFKAIQELAAKVTALEAANG